jgi:hypothetical protein
MPLQTRKIDTYSIHIQRLTRTFSSEARNVDFDEWILCKTSDNKLVRLFFLTNRDVPPKSFIDSSGNFYAFFKKDQYTYCLDLLRNERPVWAKLDPENGIIDLLSGSEPIGEGPGES